MSEETGTLYAAKREAYIKTLRPLFLPGGPITHDIINYFASLLRVFGAEDRGWDSYVESSATIEDLNSFFKIDLPEDRFPDPGATHWRIGLLLYSHIVEMDAPYEVLANLLRFRLGKGYSPNAFQEYLTEKQKSVFNRRGISTAQKIEIIQNLSVEASLPSVGTIFDEFYNNHLRNAISHSDYVLAEDDFRCRGNTSGSKAFRISYAKLDKIICAAKAFISAYFMIESSTRQF